MAVAIDLGDATDVHPRNKQDVGKRLAIGVLQRVHGVQGPPAAAVETVAV